MGKCYKCKDDLSGSPLTSLVYTYEPKEGALERVAWHKGCYKLEINKSVFTNDNGSQLLGYKIYELRTAQNLTLKELGDKCGVSPQYIHQIEYEKFRASLKVINRIADALHISLSDLFQGVIIPDEQ